MRDSDLENNETAIKIKNRVSRNGKFLGMTLEKQTISFLKCLLLYLAVLLGGGALFNLIESRHEIQSINQDNLDYHFHKNEIYNIVHEAIVVGNTSQVEEVISRLKENLKGFEERSDDPVRRWSFINALLFSFTVSSTIGYGRNAPSTTGGRIFLIFYAIIGIPLTAICLSRAADCCLHLFKWVSQLKLDKIKQTFDYFDKDHSGELDQEEFKNAMEEFGFKLTSAELEEYWFIIDFDGSGTLDLDEFREVVKNLNINLTEYASKSKENRITIITMLSWFGIGMLFFSIIENWTPFISFYFLIVSLTTIGLGDFIPQTKIGGIFLVIYAAIGLGLVAIGLTKVKRNLHELPREKYKSFKISYLKSKFAKKMRQTPIFKSLSREKIDNMIEDCEFLKFNANEKIVQEGDRLNEIFFVAKGKVSVRKSEESDKTEEISPGSLLFEPLILSDVIRGSYFADATLSASNRVKIIAIKLDDSLSSMNESYSEAKIVRMSPNTSVTKWDSENNTYDRQEDTNGNSFDKLDT